MSIPEISDPIEGIKEGDIIDFMNSLEPRGDYIQLEDIKRTLDNVTRDNLLINL